ncbi:Dynein heavy chain, N-terminal region 2/Hydrolytic ATP binding site of dynein motor region/AAA domain (dynein-related subfamily)/Dynein heavy chain AAA lid domain/P-loop containing dynein motor region/AAA+ lid domain/P-loop containing dynein motor region D4/Microtubule-binding stalk of dynein motor, putative [Angomonas deanei]|uniref:Uncharacterized protein n=1 Tax=Angomonas deanei TaxID=59799 RepID=A0A7G2CIV0_9TRYP|nr:Dynein heavy chain, N-terminal region 2/Hydrolytic ATP binding site of dynein motor region/AAA domain (dynein-related subfamily)/Dynein heavy chain AAA lid domain/P-loop containing dynein motor region/AAA+ lid domain/P-loop containing dynein motor region D4/Microtubule-binding stalk of dynein motor, putative [Angomonas deanei]
MENILSAPLSTVEDAINFFDLVDSARANGKPLPPINHLFFAKVDDGLEFHPYHIRVVQEDRKPDNYYVVTKSNVVHVNRMTSSFENLGSVKIWCKEEKQFERICQLNFFKKYLKSKALCLLLEQYKAKKFSRSRAALSKQLLLSSGIFAKTTSDIVKGAFELEWKKDTNSAKVYSSIASLAIRSDVEQKGHTEGFGSEEFLSVQYLYSSELKKYLAGALVSIASAVVQTAGLIDHEMETLQSVKVPDQNDVVGTVNREIVAESQNNLKKETKRLIVAKENLYNLVRFAHLIQVEGLFRQACRTFFELGKVVSSDSEKMSVWGFRVDCIVVKNTVSLSPNQDQLVGLIKNSLSDAVNLLANIPTSLDSGEIRKKCPFFYECQTTRALLMGDPLLLDYQLTIIDKVKEDFSVVISQLPMYQPFIEATTFLDEWNSTFSTWNRSLSLGETPFGVVSEGQMRNLSSKALALESSVHSLAGQRFGVIVVSCDTVIASLEKKLKGAVKNIREILSALIDSQKRYLLDDVLKIWKERLREPSDDLAEYTKWLEEVYGAEGAYEEFLNGIAESQSLLNLNNELIEETEDATVEKDETDLNALLRDPFLQILTSAKQHHSSKQSQMRDKVLAERTIIINSLAQISKRLDSNFGSLSASDGMAASKKLKQVAANLAELRKEAKTLDEYAQDFEMQPLKWLEFGVCEEDLKKYVELWDVHDESDKLKIQLSSVPAQKLNGTELGDTITTLFQRAFKISKIVPGDAADSVVSFLSEEKAKCALYVELCNPALKEQHFDELFERIDAKPIPAATRTLDALNAAGVFSGNEEIVTDIVSNAVGIFEIEQTIDKIEKYWETRELSAVPYSGRANTYVIDGVDELMEELEEQQVTIQTCQASKFVSEMKEQVEQWETKLITIRDVLMEWVSVQKSWMYLEFIFSSDDIKRQLPDESLLFTSADRFFTNLMKRSFSDKIAAPICLEEDMLKKLQKCTYQLDCIQKKLDEYLETKRVAFPRFYFLSNDELLSILSDSRNPLAVQPHLQKCFDNIKELVFLDTKTVSAMKSSEGEVVVFTNPVKILGNVENWLNDVERAMRETLFNKMTHCVAEYTHEKRVEWFFQHAAQCIAAVDQIVWTGDVEETITKAKDNQGAWPEYTKWFENQLLETVALVKNNLSSLERQVVSNLIVADVHCRDINTKLSSAKCVSVSDFEWLQQLRYYWATPAGSGTKDCVIHHGAATLAYGYEYLGNQPRLVITPLTERAFLTCTAALSMQKGAAPQGPAGTGKTESVKDLGKALARQVVVFNCSDGLNYKMMSQMFAGLAQGGAWACFDEFNRIELEVLSVIAQQMLDITTAIAQQLTSMTFEGHRIKLHPNFGVFITMNPGYAGRTELPDNLKALFRPICMMIPNYALIAEIMFYSEGYIKAGVLAEKMIRLYSLASQQLSKQDHYDFGMRAVKAILVVAGRLKRANPDQDEEQLLVRAICDANLPKFLTDDNYLFLALLGDFFPGVSRGEEGGEEDTNIVSVLEKNVGHTLESEGLQPTDGMKAKTVQLFDTLLTRHGLMLVGHTMTGKSTVRDSLATTLTHLSTVREKYEPHFDARTLSFFVETSSIVLNPKSISMTDLYGDVNTLTREWQDGVFSSIIRDLVKTIAASESYNKRHWIVFDGPVDAIWIENLNTVLDDNKMLCLVNGERIRIPEPITIMFEVQDLRVASPATVSRCGMVYVDKEALDGGWRPLLLTLSSRLQTIFAPHWKHDRLMELCDLVVPSLLRCVRTDGKEYIPSVDGQLVSSVFYILKASLLNLKAQMEAEKSPTSRRESRRRSSLPVRTQALLLGDQLFDAMFIQACTWGLGGNLADGFRDVFGKAFLSLIREHNLYFPGEAESQGLSVFDYCVDTVTADWQRWSDLVPAFQYNASASFFDIVVPTEHTVVLSFLLSSATTVEHHALFNGLTGTAKSSTVNNFLLSNLKTESAESAYVSFSYTLSAQTSSKSLQDTIEGKMTKRRGDKELGPQPGKKLMIAVIDDCNVPQLEEYGAAPPIELLRQLISQGGFYDRKKLFFKEVIQTMLIACCGEPGGGKNQMTPRFTSQLLLFCVPQLSAASMKTIYETILDNFFDSRSFSSEVSNLSGPVVDSTLEAYRRIAVECLPTPEKTHCTFNLRDVSKVFQGILQVKPSHCETPEQLINLWSHEASRVFHDRLIDDTDRGWWWRCCTEILQKHFTTVDQSKLTEASLREVIYGNWGSQQDRNYRQIESGPSTQSIITQYLADYNMQSTVPMNLVFFTEAINHLSRICRIISQPRGHALLVGVGGSGRSSLCRLAAFMSNMDVQTVQIIRGYNIESFRDEVRKALLDSGARGKEVVFVLSDPQIISEEMLEDVNNVLNIGEVPGMMRLEEMEVVMRLCRDACIQSGKPDTRSSVYQFFVGRCRERFHMVLCMSPMSGSFRERLRTFPALVNCTTIDWYSAWPQPALLTVAQHILSADSEGEGKGEPDLTAALSELMSFVHQSVQNISEELYVKQHRRNHTTPTSYLAALSLFHAMRSDRQKSLSGSARRYRDGLQKLENVNQTIGTLKKEIGDMQPVLSSALQEAEQQRQTVLQETAEADVLRQDCAKEEASAKALMEDAQTIRKACEEGLAEAMPALEEAERSLQTLSAKDIQEIKTFTTPPSNVEKTMNAVLILLKEKEGWASAKSCLSKMDFLNRLTGYPRDEISSAVIKKLASYINDPDFIPEVIEKTSLPCRSMCMWVHAMYKYYFVAKEVAPKRAQLEEAEKQLEEARTLLAEKQKSLQEVLDRIALLEAAAKEAKGEGGHTDAANRHGEGTTGAGGSTD